MVWPTVNNSGGTLEIPAERSKFCPNVGNSVRTSGRTFEILATRSKFEIQKKNQMCDKRSEIGLPELLVEAKYILINVPSSKI